MINRGYSIDMNVFEKTDGHPDRTGVGARSMRDLDPSHRLFIREVRNAASDLGMDVRMRGKKWPLLRRDAIEPDDYDFYESDDYRADFGVFFARTINDFGPEIGHALLRANSSMRHVMLVTTQPTSPEYEEVAQSLAAVTAEAIEDDELGMIIPIYGDYSAGERDENGTVNRISFFDIPRRRSDESRDRLRQILFSR